VYVGDGSSDIHVMLHVNQGDGLTIAVSESRQITRIARRTVISDDASSVLVPVLEEVGKFTPSDIRSLFERHGVMIQDWDRVRTDWLTIRDCDVARDDESGDEIVAPVNSMDFPRFAFGIR